MSKRDFERGKIDGSKQKDHEAEGYDQGIIHDLFWKDCNYRPPRETEQKKDYDNGYYYEKNKK